jgi:hypothetical protein
MSIAGSISQRTKTSYYRRATARYLLENRLGVLARSDA